MGKIIIAIIFIGMWLGVTISKYQKWKHRKENCITKVRATVIDVLERRPRRGSGLMYKPIFQFVSNGTVYVIDTAYYSNVMKFEKGEVFDLLVNPKNYKEFIYAEDSNNAGKKLDIMCCVMMFVGFVGMYIAILNC